MKARIEKQTKAKPAQPPEPTVTERNGKIIIHIPMMFKRRGGRKEIILPPGCRLNDDADGPSINKPLAVAVALGHRWLNLLMKGEVQSASEIAEIVGYHSSNVRRFLTLTCLSPRIVRSILNGQEPDGMSLEGLREVAVMWEEQGQIWV